MFRTTIPLALVAAGVLNAASQDLRRPLAPARGAAPAPLLAAPAAAEGLPAVRLQEERLIIEYSAATQEAVVLAEAESEEALASVVVRSPGDGSVLHLRGTGDGRGPSLSGFTVECRELSLEALFATFPAGTYAIEAQSIDGRPARGSAVLSHRLLAAPSVLYPPDGATNVSTELIVGWIPDPEAAGYQVVLEQDENDGLTVRLPAGSSSLVVPPGVLAPGKESHVEVGAIAPGGNVTLAESFFTTR
jgi:hypothetical protein